MGAWRLRAIVYGLLAVVSALVLWQSGALAGDPPRTRTLHGRTAQGSPIELTTRDGELVSFDTGRIESRCSKPGFAVAGPWAVSRWYPAIGQANVTYVPDGTAFQVHERPDPRFGDVRQRVNLYMRA